MVLLDYNHHYFFRVSQSFYSSSKTIQEGVSVVWGWGRYSNGALQMSYEDIEVLICAS